MGQIKVEKNVGGIEGLYVIEPAVHGDARGYFMETYNEKDMKEAGIDIHFVQDNQSMSTKGVLRGLHFQKQYAINSSLTPYIYKSIASDEKGKIKKATRPLVILVAGLCVVTMAFAPEVIRVFIAECGRNLY